MTSSYKKSRASRSSYYTRWILSPLGQEKADDDSCLEQTDQPLGQWYVGPVINGVRHSVLGIVDGQDFGVVRLQEDLMNFARLINGFHPSGSQKLVRNAGEKKRVAFHDFTLSAPKSVSVLWSQTDASTRRSIEAAQYRGAREFLDFMSCKAYTRIGKGGMVKVPAPLRAVLFIHYSSREDDPQLHIHCVVFNICELADGHTGSLETLEMMRWTGAASSLYHATLAFEIQKIGFNIEKKDHLFEVAGVPQEVCLAFSRRRQKILAAVRHKLQYRDGAADVLLASRAMFQTATLETRNRKSESVYNQLDDVWNARGAALGFTQAHAKALIQPERPAELLDDQALLQAARRAVRGINEKSSVFREPALVTAIAVALIGRASSAQILHSVEILKTRELLSTLPAQTHHQRGARRVIMAGTEEELIFTTCEMLVLEHQMLEFAARKASCLSLGAIGLPASLNTVQRSAALHVLTDDNAVSVILGASGSARKFVITAISRSYAQSGYSVIGLASTQSSAMALKEAAGLGDAQAIPGWRKAIQNGVLTIDHKSLLVLGDADTVSTREMVAVLRIVASVGAKVVLIGGVLDQKIIATGAGAPLRIIGNQNGAFLLDSSQGQTSESERHAVHHFFAGQAGEGLKAYAQKVHFHPDEKAVHGAIISSWQRSRLAHPRQSHLMLAIDTKSVHQLNALAHAARKAAGELGSGLMLSTLDCNLGELVEVSVNDLVVFWTKDTPPGIAKRREGILVKLSGTVIQVQTRDDGLIDIDTADEKWQHKLGCLSLAHGYAATVLSSRALMADRVWVKDALALSRISSGIAMSRHRDVCEVHVDMTVRYEAKMHITPADQWHPLEEFGTDECLVQMAHAWSAEQEKNATVDFEEWEFLGARVDVRLEVRIQRLVDKKDQRIQEQAALPSQVVSDQKRAWPAKRSGEKTSRSQAFFATENAQGHGPGGKKSLKSSAGRLLELRKNQERPQSLERPLDSSVPLRIELPISLTPTRQLKGPQASEMAINQVIECLPAEKIDADASPQVAGQGSMAFGPGGPTVACEGLPDDLNKASEHLISMSANAGQETSGVLEEAEPESAQEPSQPQDSPS